MVCKKVWQRSIWEWKCSFLISIYPFEKESEWLGYRWSCHDEWSSDSSPASESPVILNVLMSVENVAEDNTQAQPKSNFFVQKSKICGDPHNSWSEFEIPDPPTSVEFDLLGSQWMKSTADALLVCIQTFSSSFPIFRMAWSLIRIKIAYPSVRGHQENPDKISKNRRDKISGFERLPGVEGIVTSDSASVSLRSGKECRG